jgi:histidinol-phosphate aminotransferase
LALRANAHIAGISPVEHGGAGWAGLKGGGGALDFSTCCNPYGPPKEVFKALRKTDIDGYPDPRSVELVESLAQKTGVAAENVIAGSGSTEIIRLAALAYLAAGDTVVIPSPTYGEYELASRLSGATVIKYMLGEDRDFQLYIDDFISFVRGHNPRAVFLCNPNNPTGQKLPREDVRRLVKDCLNTLVILDEAYMAFTGDAGGASALLDEPNVLIIRSMTKDYALAGLRLGYGLACRDIIGNLEKVRPPWNVSSPAQQAGIVAAGSGGYIQQCNAGMQKSRAYLEGRLLKLGYKTVPTDTHFFLLRVGQAAVFKSRLLDRGFLVRDCSSFGLPSYVRISPRRPGDCQKLIKAISEMTGKAG